MFMYFNIDWIGFGYINRLGVIKQPNWPELETDQSQSA